MITVPSKPTFWSRNGLAVFGGALALVAMLVVAGALWHRPSDAAVVLATSNDCLRVFDAATCRTVVGESMAFHARTAPRFMDRRLCAMTYGEDGCREVPGLGSAPPAYVPNIAVILSTRAKAGESQVFVPLYFGRPRAGETAETGRRVFYRGRAVGDFMENKFGGARISRVNDLSGQPFTSANVRRLRRG